MEVLTDLSLAIISQSIHLPNLAPYTLKLCLLYDRLSDGSWGKQEQEQQQNRCDVYMDIVFCGVGN